MNILGDFILKFESFLFSQDPQLHLTGIQDSSSLAYFVNSQKSLLHLVPHVFVFSSDDEALSFAEDLSFFSNRFKTLLLPGFDATPYSGLFPNRKVAAQRLQWFYRSRNPGPDEIFICSPQGLMQKALPPVLFENSIFHLKKEMDLPADFISKLNALGYQAAPLVEDVGQYAARGGIIDVFSPAQDLPFRLELFGDIVESIRSFDPESGRNLGELDSVAIIPAVETLYNDENRQTISMALRSSAEERPVDREELAQVQRDVVQRHHFPGLEFLLPYFYDSLASPLDYLPEGFCLWMIDSEQTRRASDHYTEKLNREFQSAEHLVIRPSIASLFQSPEQILSQKNARKILVDPILYTDFTDQPAEALLELRVDNLKEFSAHTRSLSTQNTELIKYLQTRIRSWKDQGDTVVLAGAGQSQVERLKVLTEFEGLQPKIVDAENYDWEDLAEQQNANPALIHLVPRHLTKGFRLLSEKVTFLSAQDVFSQKTHATRKEDKGTLEQRAGALSFSDLKVGELVVHKTHGIGLFQGLKVMPIQGVEAEFIQLQYKDKDKLYVPVYRIGQIQKYSGPSAPALIDKLGSQGWEKTKIKVRSHLRDIANDLLKLYAERALLERPPFSTRDKDFLSFEASFPYDETKDQLKAIEALMTDMTSLKPMDRLICGDVGFGKTEVAMRAAFKAVQDRRQVGIIAPTTVLTFQHLETFKKRFSQWPIVIKGLNRFVSKTEQSKTLQELKEGKVDIVIGTHRLLSKDVHFDNLGLLIIDEEQKFGVRHKERLRKIKSSVDTLALSATPIPRTLNMSLMGIRDLSIINTPPVDRLPTRTFICKFDEDTIRKAVTAEINRGGQIFFIHNRVQSIYGLADELRSFLPGVRMKVAHGQLPEEELEQAMVAFFNHEIDMLVCTTIVESGMDIPRANTMFIDQAHQLGLSQLYQLRGRVGRSKERAYCYLVIPKNKTLDKEAQERLKVIQENTALGSGFKVAHYDLELRGAGDILGESQSGYINAVGYELYLELLEAEVQSAKGEKPLVEIDPEINLRIPALIPDSYIPDLRIRLSYYKSLSQIEAVEEIDRIEDELREQFGKPPEQVINLMGIMLIRKFCKDLGIRDLSAGAKSISLTLDLSTPITPKIAIELASRPTKKYQLTPENQIIIRINEITWARVVEELQLLKNSL